MRITEDYLKSIIDSTLLKPSAIPKDVELLCDEAVMIGFGAVCIRPDDVNYSSMLLHGTDVAVCTVVGFPWGIQKIKSKINEAYDAVCDGATEIDMVLNRAYLKSQDYSMLETEIKSVTNNAKNCVHAKDDVIVKVILETDKLTDDEIIEACKISEQAGADFVKTSTGAYGGATEHHVKLMKQSCNLEVKASGGIRDWDDAYKMIMAGATRLGTSGGANILKTYHNAIRLGSYVI
ncbi:MAG: deoxyribose-phosphate aldolase [Nanoarchaeota archaeon]|nr:deoxyribose-phosphate aldolase [Nanoarchaeota archaeon]MCG2719048.1 deoxyribose-phosphate aldolase [Nanoarchaeota archaeon]